MSRLHLVPLCALGAALTISACGPQQSAEEQSAPETPPMAATEQSAPESEPAADALASIVPGLAETDQSEIRRYEIQKGRVTYTMTGMQNGTEIMTWEKWGVREAKDTETTINAGGMSISQHRRVLISPEAITTIDFTTNIATQIANPTQEMMGDMKDAQAFGMAALKNMGGEQKGTDTVLGKTCDVWEIAQMGTSICIWKGVMLRMDSNMMGMAQSQVATNIEENISIDPELFKVPAGVTVQNMPTGGMMMPGGMPKMPDGFKMPEGMPQMPGMPGAPGNN